MSRTSLYLRAAALASAVALAGGFVAYRAGAFATPAAPDPQPTAGPTAPAEAPTGTEPAHPAIMYGSKSAPTFMPGSKSIQFVENATGLLPPGVTPSVPASSPPAPSTLPELKALGDPSTFMGGSKYIVIAPPQGRADPPPAASAPGGSPPAPPKAPSP
jgi:hypothetical protein